MTAAQDTRTAMPRPRTGSERPAEPPQPSAADIHSPCKAPALPAVTDRERLAELSRLGVLETYAEAEFDALVEIAAQLCETPIALVTLIDAHREWFKARVGLDLRETGLADSFGVHALDRRDILVVTDALSDPRFAGKALVAGEPGVRFYAGAPLVTPAGAVVGTLCVLDLRPRDLTSNQRTRLTQLADQVMAQMLLRRQAGELASRRGAQESTHEALLANERLLRGVLSHPEAVIFAKDLEGRYLMCNPTGHRLFGVAENELIGRTDTEVLDADSASVLQRTDRQVLQDGSWITVTESFVQAGGSHRDYRTTKFPLRDQNGVVYGVAGISTDITSQLVAERALRQSETRWRQLFDASPVGIGLMDQHGRWLAVNPALCAILGRPASDVLDRASDAFVHPADNFDIDSVSALIADTTGGAPHCEVRFRLPSGEYRWIWSTLAHTLSPEGQRWTIAHVQDVTERLAAEQAARDSQADLTAVMDVVHLVQTAADAHRILIQACIDLAGADTACLLKPDPDYTVLEGIAASCPGAHGQRIPLAVPYSGPQGLDPRAAAFLSGESVLTKQRLPHTPGVAATAPGAGFLVPIRSAAGVSAVLAVEWSPPGPGPDDRRIQVVSLLAEQAGSALSQRSLLTELNALAHTDALTGLPNRRGWDVRLHALLTLVPAGRGLVVALIDFDHFKNYNDTRGHAAGDVLISGFARRARAQLKAGDMLARWGGEEFALSLVDCAPADAGAVLERVRGAMPDGQTCSIGYVLVEPGDRPDDLMARADTALYRAKNTGRDRVYRHSG